MSSEANITKIVGENVRRAREAIGLSQEELGDKAGIDRTYVSGVERGVRNPTVKVLARLADALGVPPAQLLARDDGAAQGGESRRSGSSS